MRNIRKGQRIAVVGSGITGLAAAWLLSKQNDVVLYESEGRPGGHTRTIDVATSDGGVLGVDTGSCSPSPRTSFRDASGRCCATLSASTARRGRRSAASAT
jgi:thioredoxin reductase